MKSPLWNCDPLRVEELLAEAHWVERLARKLVGDGAAAEDLVQETWLAALRASPREAGTLRPWLAHVLANFARHRARSDANRRRRERVQACAEAMPSASDVVERIDAQQALAAALGELAEPYRTTVILRYFDELSAAEIARRQGIPAGTVRWRLKQGLDDLRARLDVRFGGRGAWCVAFLPLLRDAPLPSLPFSMASISGAALASKVIAMSLITRVITVAAIAVALTIGVWFATSDGTGSLAVAPLEVASAPDRELTAPDNDPAVVQPDAGTRSALLGSGDEEPLASVPAATIVSTARVEARCVDEVGRALAGAELALLDFGREARATSDANGRIEIEIELEKDDVKGRWRLVCADRATRFAPLVLDRAKTVRLGDLALAPGATVLGEVVDPEGRPVAGATVFAVAAETFATMIGFVRSTEESRRLGPSTAPGVPTTESDAHGAFTLTGIEARNVRIWAHAEGTLYTWSEPIDLAPYARRDGVRLVLAALAAEHRIEGIVRAPDGSPVPRAHVRYTWQWPETSGSADMIADDQGRFRLVVRERLPYSFRASDPAKRWPEVSASEVAPGTLDLVLAFHEPERTALSVRARDGAPIERFTGYLRSKTSGFASTIEDAAHLGGRVLLALPNERFTLVVEARGYARGELGPFEPGRVPFELGLELDPLAGIRGRVLAGGSPVAGVRVEARRLVGPREKVDLDGFALRVQTHAYDTARTDPEGRFELFLRFAGEHALFARAEGFALAELGPLDVDPVRAVEGLEIELARGGAIEGRVILPPGRDPAGVVVSASRADGLPRTQRVGSDGAFRFERLTPGGWLVARAAREAREGDGTTTSRRVPEGYRIETNLHVEDGKTTRFDLDLCDSEPCGVRVRAVLGEPLHGWMVRLTTTSLGAGETVLGGILDERGELAIELGGPGLWQASLRPPPESTLGLELTQDLAIARGSNEWRVEPSVGRIAGRTAGGNAAAPGTWRLSSGEAGALRVSAKLDVGTDGRFEIGPLPVGQARFLRWEVNTTGGGMLKQAVVVEVLAGKTVEVELR